tara:strand:+ start:902 stop:1366 length:465 start_codon:yes stop_codon:yes gene_type:complete
LTLSRFIASGFWTGYWPLIAPGSFASFISLCLFIVIKVFITTNPLVLTIITVLLILIGFWSCQKIVSIEEPDPSYCVIDEWAGQWVTVLFIPFEWYFLVLGFFLFRLLDIFKPFGIKRLEQISGGAGIMWDDLAAGVLGSILITVLALGLSAVK